MLTTQEIEMIRQGLLASDWCGYSKRGTINALCDMAASVVDTGKPVQTMTRSIEIMDQIVFRLKMTPDDKERYLWLALAGEVGEALNLVKKQWRDGFTEERIRLLKTELADVYIYLRVMEAFYGMNVHQWALEKMKEVDKRPFAQPQFDPYEGKGDK